jgi:hypothetical protein
MSFNLSISYSLILTIGVAIMIFSNSNANAQQQNETDFVLDIDKSGKVNEFFIKGPEICKSENCKYEIADSSTLLTNAPEYDIYYSIDFRILDEANKDLTPKKRELIEQWRIGGYCNTHDIIEKPNGQERYLCSDLVQLVHNNFEQYWYYQSNGTYFIPEDKFILNGTFNGR